MTDDISSLDKTKAQAEDTAAPPLCLVHYFGAEAAYSPERNPKPPGTDTVGRIAERRGNLIILDFAPPAKLAQARPDGRKLFAKIANALFLLLLLICAIGCAAAFRF